MEKKSNKSPVFENNFVSYYYFLSRIRHVKPGLNLGRPLSKAKILLEIDSELVP